MAALNIVTHADHRGGGYASRCVGALLDALFGKVDNVALNVRTDNEPNRTTENSDLQSATLSEDGHTLANLGEVGVPKDFSFGQAGPQHDPTESIT